ncbi:hypothetical protein BpHYR1_025527 [Brachionus plicatilis]|uniref:Uncharacterized protein n=1 Tax=Brachionus plicatilis TaxID=10195 RepID=A0A3M7RC11_BRAPC|nr:hypothetical protein BpHYR1_025527 [Brachionus plicatilis]
MDSWLMLSGRLTAAVLQNFFLPLHSPVLVPRFDLELRQAQRFGQLNSVRSRQVLLILEPFLQSYELHVRENGACSPALLVMHQRVEQSGQMKLLFARAAKTHGQLSLALSQH